METEKRDQAPCHALTHDQHGDPFAAGEQPDRVGTACRAAGIAAQRSGRGYLWLDLLALRSAHGHAHPFHDRCGAAWGAAGIV